MRSYTILERLIFCVPRDTLAALRSGKGNVIKAVFAGSVKRFTQSGKYRVGTKGATFHSDGHIVSLHLSSDVSVRCL